MKLIDNRGRLFGVINLIDLLAVILIAGAVISIVANVSGLMKAKDTTAELYIKLMCRVPDEVANNPKLLQPGDVILGGNATIEKVLDIRPVKDVDGMPLGSSDVIFLIKGRCVILNGEYYCANIPVKINSPMTLSNPVYTVVNALILDVDRTAERMK